MRVIHPVTGLKPGEIIGDNKTNGLDLAELMQYRTAGMLALGVDMKKTNPENNTKIELSQILGAGIA